MKKILLSLPLLILMVTAVHAQPKTPWTMDSILAKGPEYGLLSTLTGNWSVIQILYSKDDASVQSRDTFSVERKLVGNFFQETMRPISVKPGGDFTRISYLSYNRTNLRWEYIVLDTRFPVMMFETSKEPDMKTANTLDLYLDAFPCPPFFGPAYTGLMTSQHRQIIFAGKNSTIHKQFWTLPGGKEFLAIEYDFVRR